MTLYQDSQYMPKSNLPRLRKPPYTCCPHCYSRLKPGLQGSFYCVNKKNCSSARHNKIWTEDYLRGYHYGFDKAMNAAYQMSVFFGDVVPTAKKK